MRYNNKVALTGTILSGKTTFARYLQGYHGYYLVSFTDQLKEVYAQTYSPPITVEYIIRHKEGFRRRLQEFGEENGFDTGDRVPYWVDRSLKAWRVSGVPRVVFDNVRTPDQASYLAELGFTLVRLTISDAVREARARQAGLDITAIMKSMEHSVERAQFPVDITLNDTQSWSKAALIVMKGKRNDRPKIRLT